MLCNPLKDRGERAHALEPMNPTASPAKSPFLNGVWEFLYTGGMNPGTLAVQVGTTRVEILDFMGGSDARIRWGDAL